MAITHPQAREIRTVLRTAAQEYPAKFRQWALEDVDRATFNVEMALSSQPEKPLEAMHLVDLGGNFSLFAVGCKKLGFAKVTVIDDFRDPVNLENGDSLLDIHKSLGINIVDQDLVRDAAGSLPAADIFATFDSMEHWHHSPKALFAAVSQRMSDGGGGFVLGVPNCVNLRKRITVPFGYGKWSHMSDWYERADFRGHVREPDVGDLRYIASDMNLHNVRIVGRNWTGTKNHRKWLRPLARLIDLPLRMFPSACGDIYLIGQR